MSIWQLPPTFTHFYLCRKNFRKLVEISSSKLQGGKLTGKQLAENIAAIFKKSFHPSIVQIL